MNVGEEGSIVGVRAPLEPRSEAARLLTAADLGARWQIPPSQVHNLRRSGRLPAVALGRYVRFSLTDVEAFERNGGAA